ncbi:Plasmodium exported protein, unknown function [Plasmodium ovale]|uniref:Pv-fam-d protein n=2 Tax=Plasmodium ovale TaxID=36330 RepID=A0A1A8XCS5_PLAOA|nr:Plasmodium exported protein, unknown function [Plasmodium ovale curtisi]SBT02104.1 Plasmodium exported protein, unknown function [Plasmodium ovale curtisi]SBT84305.1 Plasmodium exported protein, unknown function [Plasmodium ovale]
MHYFVKNVGKSLCKGAKKCHTSCVRNSRLLIGGTELLTEERYSGLRGRIADVLREDDAAFGKRLNALINDEAFRKQFNSVIQNANFQKQFENFMHFDALKLYEKLKHDKLKHDTLKHDTLKHDTLKLNYDNLKHDRLKHDSLKHDDLKYDNSKYDNLNYHNLNYDKIKYNNLKQFDHVKSYDEFGHYGGFEKRFNAVEPDDNYKNISDSFKHINHMEKHYDALSYQGDFQNQHSPLNTYDNYENEFDGLTYRDEYEKLFYNKKYDKGFKLGNKVDKLKFLKPSKYKGKGKRRRKSGIQELLKNIDSKFELEMLRAKKTRGGKKSFIKSKKKYNFFVRFMKKYRTLSPLILTVTTIIMFIAMGLEMPATVFAVIAILMVFYYEIKLNKLKKMSKVYKEFRSRNKFMRKKH